MSSENDLPNLPNQLKRLEAIRGGAVRYAPAKDLEREGVLFVQDGNHGNNRPRQEEFVEHSTPFVRPPDLVGGEVCFASCDHINDKAFSRIRKGIGKPGDILLTTNATIGRIAKAKKNAPETFVVNPQVTLWRSTKKGVIDQGYLYCFMRDSSFMDQLWSFCGDNSTFNYVCLSLQKEIYLVLPDIEEQKAIAHILGTLDDKIELNSKTNETLEAMAKALFKSWFVDFDPVRAKAEGRPTGLPGEISDLFPDSFEDSELGETPRGWEGGTFGSFTTAKRGKIITRKDTIEGSIPVVAGGMEPAYYHNQSNVDAPVVTISASGANAGFVNLYFQPVWASDCSYISQNESKFPLTCYLFLKLSQQRIYDAQHGGVQPHINPGDLARLDFINATEKIFETFEGIVGSVFDKVASAIEQSKHLETLRDALLPKLISGEIRIPDAEKILEEVGV